MSGYVGVTCGCGHDADVHDDFGCSNCGGWTGGPEGHVYDCTKTGHELYRDEIGRLRAVLRRLIPAEPVTYLKSAPDMPEDDSRR